MWAAFLHCKKLSPKLSQPVGSMSGLHAAFLGCRLGAESRAQALQARGLPETARVARHRQQFGAGGYGGTCLGGYGGLCLGGSCEECAGGDSQARNLKSMLGARW